MKIATWNINSIRQRLDIVLDWVEANDPDVVCLQETKVIDQEFPEDELGDLDYDAVYIGERSYNGVAIAAHEELTDVKIGLPGDADDAQPRLIRATVEDIRVICAYCPNGKSLESDAYAFKLDWFDRLLTLLKEEASPDQPLVLCGDFNICPADIDEHDECEPNGLFASPPERERFNALIDWGLTDVYRHLYPDNQAFTWWHYRDASFIRNTGLRIDHFLVTKSVLDRVNDVTIDVAEREKDNCSDHAPLILHLD